jgi:hypothetical protein
MMRPRPLRRLIPCVLVVLVLAACSGSAKEAADSTQAPTATEAVPSTTAPTTTADVGTDQPDFLDGGTIEYVAIDGSGIMLQPFEEDWCNRFEGRVGGWLIADESELVVDVVSGEPFSLDPDSRGLLVTIASEGASGVTPYELAQLDTFLRLPVPSPLACRIAYEARNK